MRAAALLLLAAGAAGARGCSVADFDTVADHRTDNNAALRRAAAGYAGGELCVEASPREVAVVDTRGRMAKLDGRFPHWVAPYTGERYSLIWFRKEGPLVAKTTAVFDEDDGS